MQHHSGISSHCNKTRKEGVQIGKEEIKLSLFTDDMIDHTENPPQKIMENKTTPRTSEFSTEAGNKINIQKNNHINTY